MRSNANAVPGTKTAKEQTRRSQHLNNNLPLEISPGRVRLRRAKKQIGRAVFNKSSAMDKDDFLSQPTRLTDIMGNQYHRRPGRISLNQKRLNLLDRCGI